MRAAVLTAYGEPLAIENVDPPEPAPHGAVIEVAACGICRSDWHAWQGHGEWADDQAPLGQVLGHETAGKVLSVGDRVDRIEPGDRIAVPFNLGQGTCKQCRRGHGNVCENGLALGFEPAVPGAFAEQTHIPYADFNAVTVSSDIDAVDVAALGCRYVTAYYALEHRANVGGGDWVAVHGCGGVGLAAVQIADALGARVVAVDIRGEPLELAAAVGADVTIQATEETDVPREIIDATNGGAAVSIDALGRAETCRNSVRCLETRGTHVQVGLTTDAERGTISLPVDAITHRDISFLGSHGMPPSRYDELLGMIESGRLDPGALVTQTVSLEDVSERLAAMSSYETSGIEVMTFDSR